ncbi:MAG: 6-bladed beta-propeller [Longimicrobiales bacterium]
MHSAPSRTPRPGPTPSLRRPAPALILAAAAGFLSACGGDGTEVASGEWAGSVSDSSGVAVVDNPAQGVWGAAPAWQVTEELRIGGASAGSDAQFGLVVGVDVDADGNVYVADQQAQHVQVFDAEGRFLHTIGGPGSGPGEIGQALAGVFVVGGEVWVADMANLRLNRYAPDGEALGSTPIDPTNGIPMRWDRVGDRLVAQLRFLGMGDAPAAGTDDAVVTMGTPTRDTVTVLSGGTSLQMEGGRPQIRIFGSEPIWDAAADGRVLSGLNSGYRLEVRDASGTLQRVITKPFETEEVTEADVTRLRRTIRQLMLDQGAPPQAVDALIQGMSFADRFPAFAQILAGPSGTVWVQHIQSMESLTAGDAEFNPQDLGSDNWDVFDGEGRYLGVMTLPDRFAPLLVDGDAFWGVQRDQFDVNSVVRFRVAMSG